MLLFSTILEIDNRMTKDDFIRLVIEWNQKGHQGSRIPDIEWNGERNIRFGDDKKWLEIQEYRNKNIIAVRYEKREEDGAVWDTDYIMNFEKMKMAIRLNRSYVEDAIIVDEKFFTPYLISLLIDKSYIKKDGNLEVRRRPLMITEKNLDLLVDIVNGIAKYKLPVVVITKTFYDEDPIDVNRLSKELKGVAHVLVQESNCTNPRLKDLCHGQNEYYGAIGIYHPNPVIGHRKYLYRTSEGIDRILYEKVTRTIMQYNNSQMVEPLYTWFGVNNAILQDRLISKRKENAEVEEGRRAALYELLTLKSDLTEKQASMKQQALEEAKAEADKILESFEEDMQKKDREIKRLSSELEKKEREVSWLKAKLDSMTAVPVIVAGNEDDFYPGEVKDFVLRAVKDALNGTEPRSRRYDVLKDIFDANNYQKEGEERGKEVKRLLSNYSGMTPKIKVGLEKIGFVFDLSDHQKVKYYGDDRYTIIYGSTPSDNDHGGKNNVRNTIKKAF